VGTTEQVARVEDEDDEIVLPKDTFEELMLLTDGMLIISRELDDVIEALYPLLELEDRDKTKLFTIVETLWLVPVDTREVSKPELIVEEEVLVIDAAFVVERIEPVTAVV
jgi:hypothetical protein